MRPPRPVDWAAAVAVGAAEDGQMSNASAEAAMTAAGGAAEDGPGAPLAITHGPAVGTRAEAGAGAKQTCLDPIMAHSNPRTRIAFRQQGLLVRRTKLAGTQKLKSENYLEELQLVRGAGTVLRTGIVAAARAAGAAGAPARVRAGARAEAAAGAAAEAWRLTKATATDTHDYRGRQHKQLRAAGAVASPGAAMHGPAAEAL